jgi:hypothetical protein
MPGFFISAGFVTILIATITAGIQGIEQPWTTR